MNTSDSHLDAEMLAAWADGGLTGDELRMTQSHVAGCARCQALVGAMARTEAAVPQPEPQRSPRRWLAWAVPLTAAATALVIWTTVPRNTTTGTSPITEAARTQAAPTQPEVVTSPEVIPEKEAPVEKKAENPAPARPAEARDQIAENKAAAGAPAAPPASEVSGEASREASNDASKDVAAAAPRALAAPAAARAQANFAAAAPRIQDLCGASWTSAAPAVTTPLTAGSSPSPQVCWVVGRLGVVLLTTDARTWKGITFPVITDLSAVTATDARNATVMTTDGRSFTTTDGGMTWTPRSP